MKDFPINSRLRAFGSAFTLQGYSLYLVGGAVRDFLLGMENHDYDFTTDARPEEVIALFPHQCIPTGIKHGTITVRFQKESYEVTTFRTEGEYQDGRHPDCVDFVRDLASDLERRDFTINALACNIENGKIIDLHEGIQDLKARTIRAIGNPHERFREDALRMLRACRFASKLGFSVEAETKKAMTEIAGTITKVSPERIKEELFALISASHPEQGLTLLEETGLLSILIPEMAANVGLEQKGYHKHDVWTHTILAVKAAAEANASTSVRLAAFFHDIGKAATRELKDDGSYSFIGHENIGAEMTRQILLRLRASNEEIETITHLVKEHMFHYTSDWSDGAVRRFIRRVGVDSTPPLFALRLADQKAIAGSCDWETLESLDERIKKVLASNEALTIKDLAVNGYDLIRMGIPKGPELGLTLSYLLEQTLEDPNLNEKGKLLTLAKRYQERDI